MKPLYWDAINPFTGKPFTYDDPNVRWGGYLEPGDEGFVPYPDPPADDGKSKAPFRRRARARSGEDPALPNPNSTTDMPTFKFTPAPNPKGGFTTRAVLGTLIDQTALTAEIATATGVTPAQVEAVVTTLLSKLLTCSEGCGWSPGLYGSLRVRPTSGGSEPAPDAFHTAQDINADVALSFTADAIRDWRAGLSLESQGEVGLVTPVVDSILDIATGLADHYTIAGMIQLRGNNLRIKFSDPAQGVFFRSGASAEVRATLYGQNEPGILSAAVPTGLTGPLTVRVAAFINGSVRSYTYTHQIT